MVRVRGIALALVLAASSACDSKAPSTAQRKTAFDSLPELQTIAMGAMSHAGLASENVSLLPGMHRLRQVEKSVVKFKHWVYVDRPFTQGDVVWEREGFMLLLGEKDGKVLALTTQCGASFRYGIQYEDPGIDRKNPGFVVGVLALETPRGQGRDFYIVEEETNFSSELFDHPGTSFGGETWVGPDLFKRMGIDGRFWNTLLESGDRINIHPFENNDLAFVSFSRKKDLGATYNEGSLIVSKVRPGSPAARGELQTGDVIVSINGRRVSKKRDEEDALAKSSFDQVIPLEVRRKGSIIRCQTFWHFGGNFVTQGKVGTLGLERPDEVVTNLLAELDKVGGLMRRELSVKCHICIKREQDAKLVIPPTRMEFVAGVAKTAAGLLGAEGVVDTAVGFGKAYEWFSEFQSQVGDLEAFMKTSFSLGEPMELDLENTSVLTGDRMETVQRDGQRVTLQLAYLKATDDEQGAFLRNIIGLCRSQKNSLVFIPEGKDRKGCVHGQLLVMRPIERSGTKTRNPSDYGLVAYVNLSMVWMKKALVFDHNVGDGYSTRFLLRALKKVEEVVKQVQ